MSDSKGLVPGPMTKRRLALMQARAEAGEPLAVASDQEAIRASIEKRLRHKTQRRDGLHTAARKVGVRAKPTADARFDEDGEAIEKDELFDAVDRYLVTQPGSDDAAEAMRLWKIEREFKCS